MRSVEAYWGNFEWREPSQYSLLDPGKPRKTRVEMAGRTARHHLHCTTLFMNIRWKWVSYFFYSHSELAIKFASPQFSQLIFLAVLLTNESVALIVFHRCWRIFVARIWSSFPVSWVAFQRSSPSSSTGSGRYFLRNVETSPGSEGIWDLETRCFH